MSGGMLDDLRRKTWPELPEGRVVEPQGSGWVRRNSGIIVPERYHERPRPKAMDLFCGAGGFSLGLIAAGFQVIAAADAWATAAVTYMYNLGAYPAQFVFIEEEDRARLEKTLARGRRKKGVMEQMTSGGARGGRDLAPGYPGVGHFFLGDIRKITGQQMLDIVGLGVGELDLLVGGPPCQGFSIAGKQNVMDPRNSLVFEFCRLVCEMRPKSIVMEEVPAILNMVTPDGASVVDEICRILSEGDYTSFDAARQVLQANPGSRKINRRRDPKHKIEREQDVPEEAAPAQPSLFPAAS